MVIIGRIGEAGLNHTETPGQIESADIGLLPIRHRDQIALARTQIKSLGIPGLREVHIDLRTISGMAERYVLESIAPPFGTDRHAQCSRMSLNPDTLERTILVIG